MNMHKPLNPGDGGYETGPLDKKAARRRAKRSPVTTGNNLPKRAADPAKQSSRQVRPRTAEDIANEVTAEQLALRIWAAIVAQKVLSGMSSLMDELLQSHLLDDDDEEGDDEGWLDDHQKREKKILDEAISDGLDTYPDFAAINNLSPNSDLDIAQDAGQLKDALTKCAIGATEFKGKFSRAQLERMVERNLEMKFKKDPRYSKHVSDTWRDWTSRHTAAGVAPRRRVRCRKLPIMRAAAGCCSRRNHLRHRHVVAATWEKDCEVRHIDCYNRALGNDAVAKQTFRDGHHRRAPRSSAPSSSKWPARIARLWRCLAGLGEVTAPIEVLRRWRPRRHDCCAPTPPRSKRYGA